ncbi:MAG TPA: response regulator transcription factor [Candidatus Dormibacteraeota bacterium]
MAAGRAGARILLVEDDRALRGLVASALEAEGHEILLAGDGLTALEQARGGAPDVVLLDLGLPVADGWHVLRELGGRRVPSVVVISARGDERDKVKALDMGADDYLAKPFGADELLARVRAVLRRSRSARAEAPQRVATGAVVVDLSTRTVVRHGQEVILSPTEYLLLAELARRAGATVDHLTLLASVWGPGYGSERNYLRTFVARLRAKLEDDPAQPGVIVTVGRLGYRFGPAAAAPDRAPETGRSRPG